MKPNLEIQNLSKQFPRSATAVFSQLNLQIPLGEFIVLLGPSGCGKSTLLRLLAGLEKATTGQILGLENLKKSIVFQEPRLLPWQTCLENTLLPATLAHEDKKSAAARALSLLKNLHLDHALHHFPAELSGGMKMRTSLARSLMLNPDLLLLDEPFSALDEEIRLSLQDELRRLYSQNKWTVIFVTHSVEEACFLADRIFIFEKTAKNLHEVKMPFPAERSPRLREQEIFLSQVQQIRSRLRSPGNNL